MVQVLADLAASPNGTPAHEGSNGQLVGRPNPQRSDSSSPMTRDEHAQRMRELNKKRGLMRTPRRGWSLTDYPEENDSAPQHNSGNSGSSQVERHASIPENAPLASQDLPQDRTRQLPRRPKLPPPRRSYSVQDYEPAPPCQPKPPKNYSVLDLPNELHYAIFDYLDPIDSACFGLTNSNFYAIHRRLHGTVPLSSRYSGPNTMEWAWRGAGPLVHKPAIKDDAKDEIRVKGQIYCRKCGISRCELHRHIREWMGEGYEYCSIKEVFGQPADEDAKPYCYMKSPKNPHLCGRHRAKKTVSPA